MSGGNGRRRLIPRWLYSRYCRLTLRWGGYWCVRVNVRRNNWHKPAPTKGEQPLPRSPDEPEDVHLALQDFALKPKDEGGLSLYAARTCDELRRIALLHQVTNGKPDSSHYLCIPSRCVTRLPTTVLVIREGIEGQHPALKRHHYSVYGLTDELLRTELVRMILRELPRCRLDGWTRSQIKAEAAPLTADATVRSFMRFADSW